MITLDVLFLGGAVVSALVSAAYYRGRDQGKLEATQFWTTGPADLFCEHLIEKIQAAVEKEAGSREELEYDAIMSEINGIQTTLQTKMPDAFLVIAIGRIRTLTHRKDELLRLTDFRCGDRYRKILRECAQVEVEKAIDFRPPELIVEDARSEYQKMMAENVKKNLISGVRGIA